MKYIVHAFRQEQNRLKEERIRARCKKITEEKEKLTKEVVKVGLWSTGDEIAKELALIKGVTKQRNAIKIQLQFRQKVLCQQYPDRNIFHVSAGGKQKSVKDLQQNLTLLVVQGLCPSENSVSATSAVDFIVNPYLLVGRNVEHLFVESDGTERWYTGTVLNMDAEKCYQISYEEEDHEEVYCFNLLEDLLIGDLIILN